MVNPATLKLIFDVIVAIQETADHVQCNREDCMNIKRRLELLKKYLPRLENNEQLMKDLAVGSAVVALHNILPEAKKLVDKCKVQRNIIRLWWEARRLSKKLSRMDNSISCGNVDLMTALTIYQNSPTQHGVHPPALEPVGAPAGEMAKQPSSMLHEIVDTASQINAMTKTVRRNRWECFEVDKRAGTVSAFLPRLENTEMMNDPALSADLEKLVKTFHHAHELVTACQTRNLVPSACQGGYGGLNKDRELSKELRQVLDQMVLDLDGMTEISMRYARGNREGATTLSARFTATLMVSRFVTKLWLGRQRSKGITLQLRH